MFVIPTEHESECLEEIGIKPGISIPSGRHILSLLVTGVGTINTAWAMKTWFQMNGKPDLAVNAGIAGSLNDDITTGEVVMPVSDCFADLGIETPGGFIPLKDTVFMQPDEFPFVEGKILCDNEFSRKALKIVKPVRGITVNTVTGTEATRERLKRLYSADIETMEGAAFFYVCTRENIPFLALRAVSNRAGNRDISSWDIALALGNLSEKIEELVNLL